MKTNPHANNYGTAIETTRTDESALFLTNIVLLWLWASVRLPVCTCGTTASTVVRQHVHLSADTDSQCQSACSVAGYILKAGCHSQGPAAEDSQHGDPQGNLLCEQEPAGSRPSGAPARPPESSRKPLGFFCGRGHILIKEEKLMTTMMCEYQDSATVSHSTADKAEPCLAEMTLEEMWVTPILFPHDKSSLCITNTRHSQ